MNRRLLALAAVLVLALAGWLALRASHGPTRPPDPPPATHPPPPPAPTITATADPTAPARMKSERTHEPPKRKPASAAYPVAKALPDKPGFVLSPYNNKIVDVRDLPSGSLVRDPSFPAEERAYFRVP